jgi:D-glycerate 3-kinase
MSPLYADVLSFCRSQLALHSRRPLVIGIQGPQGAGKTTLTRALLEALPAINLSGTAVSIDDFYMTRAGQLAVAAAHPGNRYLEHRGYPGTHDIDLGEQTLAAVVGVASAGAVGAAPPGVVGASLAAVVGGRSGGPSGPPITIPVYDKSAHGGRGDRAPVDQWRTVSMPLDLVFIEGWMLGFEPVPDASLTDPDLAAPNRALAEYARWHRYIDAWVVLRALDPSYVLTWRVEAEERMKASGKPGLSRADIEDYIRRFLPAYQTWGGAPAGVPPERRLDVRVGLDRGTAGRQS